MEGRADLMMTLYRATLRPLAAYASPLQGDTFFGAFCWAYRDLYGEQALADWLHCQLAQGPQLIFSNAFPSGYLPLPAGAQDADRPAHIRAEKQAAQAAYRQNKLIKKCDLVSLQGFEVLRRGQRRGFAQYLARDGVSQVQAQHNTVDRDSGAAASRQSGGAFVATEHHAPVGQTYDVYLLSALPVQQLEAGLRLMLARGIGADKSTGKGAFELLALAPCPEYLDCPGANGFVALGNFIPAAADPTEGQYRTLVKYGRLDRQYAAGPAPFKKPLLYLAAGAIFADAAPRPWYGRFVEDVSLMPGVVVNGCTVALPVILP